MLTRAWRLRRYSRLVNTHPLVVTDSDTIVDNLQRIWRCLKPEDFLPIDPEFRNSEHLNVSYPNLPALVRALSEQNALIEKEADGLLEQRLSQAKNNRCLVNLDFYLADDEHYPIDEIKYLNRMRGLLQVHKYLVDKHPGHYYERHSEMLYKDIVTLTHVLINYTNRAR